MLSRVIAAIIVGIIVAIVVVIIGLALTAVGLVTVGEPVKGFAPLVGLLAGLWFFLTGRSLL